MLLFDEEQYRKVLLRTFELNKDVNFKRISLVKCIASESSEKYVGCVHCKNDNDEEVIVNINNSAPKTMLYYPKKCDVEFIGEIPGLHFSYTGGCTWKNRHIYGFMRNSCRLLDIDINMKTVKEVDCSIDGSKLNSRTVMGHHYGGVMKNDTLVIPPRLAEDVLLIDLEHQTCKQVRHSAFRDNNYNGAVLHPNGKVYFTPMHGSAVAEFDLENLSVRMVGERISNSLFGGAVYIDGCIYSFSQNKGLYCIDPKRGCVELVLEKTEEGCQIFGSYGTVLHYNGKIYNIPGNSKYVYEYDPTKQNCKVVSTFNDGRFNTAKWAGGVLLENGNIYLTPAFGRFVCELHFDKKAIVSDDMRALIYSQYMKVL
ncbi:PQQ-binding-like beta-propeller repeat protein [Selenomonas sp. AB3002]|uniref:PQQ-binding-like beta-propeller repeat protein n=1 Tax=Selenomonas sp. AB3002 TaxID=1392502 RepID=UPI000495FD02